MVFGSSCCNVVSLPTRSPTSRRISSASDAASMARSNSSRISLLVPGSCCLKILHQKTYIFLEKTDLITVFFSYFSANLIPVFGRENVGKSRPRWTWVCAKATKLQPSMRRSPSARKLSTAWKAACKASSHRRHEF